MVEDDEQMGALLQRGLSDEGYRVSVAPDGMQALIKARETPPSIAILDVMLPGMSGFEVCKWLRELDPSVRVLMLTARDDVDDRVRGLDAGADDYLIKPFAFTELTARLRALRRRDALQPQTHLELGEVSMDALKHIVTVRGRTLHLSPKEFALLQLLMQNLGEAVPRTTILSELWGTTAHADANIVDQYVSYLRKKLDPLEAGVGILTERGVGFRIAAV